MTDDMMALRGLLEKSSDADLLREMIGFTAQRLMALEVEGLTGASHGERSLERINQRNGYLAPGAAHRVLADLAPEQAGQRSADTARVGAGKVRIGDNRLGPFGQPLVGLDGLAPPFLLTAIPIEQADAGERNRQRSEGADKLPMPVAVAITLGRAAALIARTAAQRRLRFLRHHSLDEGADAKADRILQGIEPILTGKWTGRRRCVKCFMA